MPALRDKTITHLLEECRIYSHEIETRRTTNTHQTRLAHYKLLRTDVLSQSLARSFIPAPKALA